MGLQRSAVYQQSLYKRKAMYFGKDILLSGEGAQLLLISVVIYNYNLTHKF